MRRFAAPFACVVWLASGCFSPDLDGPCEASCTLGCPRGWTCDHGYCIPPGYPNSCESAAAGGGSGGALSSSSGGETSLRGGATSSPGGATGNFGGAPTWSGAASTSGGAQPTGGGSEGGAPPSIDVQLTSPASPCSGDVSLELKASAGQPPYEWSPETTCGLSVESGPQGTARLTGAAPPGDCTISVSVRDSEGARGELNTPITFREVPALDLIKLKPACLFEDFEAPLTSHGGDASSRRLETMTPGWTIAGGTLRTHVDAQTQRTVSVTVRDDYCASQPVDLELPSEATDSARCFGISFMPRPRLDARDVPSPPCAGMPYELDINATPEPKSSNIVHLPPGLSKTTSRDGSAISLTGTASWPAGEKSSLQVQLVQNDGRRFSYSYDLSPRDKCWFAYVARDSGPWQLHLLDPELSDGRSFAHRVFGASDAEVTSFSFSPNGSFLVYQSTQTAKVGLTLIDLRRLREQSLSFTGSVEQYRWSPDSSLLAVVSRDTNTILGAIDLSGVATSSQLETGIQGVTNIAPLTTGIESGPEWFGEHSLALTTRSSVNSSSYATRYLRVEGQTFSPVVEVSGSYIPLPNTVGFSDGYVVSNGLLLNFINTSTWSNPAVVPHMINSLTSLAPNGAYAGNTSDDGTLRWYAPQSFEFQGAAATSEPGQCSIVLAWSDDGARAACVTDTDTGPLRFLKRGSSDSSKLTASVSTNATDYSQQASNERRRVFSADGRLFGFTTDLNLYVSDAERPQVFFAYRTAEGDTSAARADEANTIDLAFSFDAKFLAEHRANKLTVIAVTSGSNDYWVLDDKMNLAPDCGERYITSPKAWCGAASAPRDYRWSSHANWLAYLTHEQLLNLTYLPVHSHQIEKRSVISKCDDQCIRSLEFQP